MNPNNAECLPAGRKGLPATVMILALYLAFVLALELGGSAFSDRRDGVIAGMTLAFLCFLLFMMLRTGRVNRWRRIFFTTYAVMFAIQFVWWTMGDRGHMWLLDQEILYAKAPMCHMVVPMLLLPLLFRQEVIFPVQLMQGLSFLVIVLAVTVFYGRAFCSWGCFFGGQDELFAAIPRRKRWDITRLHPYVRYFSFAFLLVIVLHSFATLSPTYCFWFCPFKVSSEFIEVNSFIRVLQTFLFVGLWVLLVAVVPLLSKKRSQCGLFCPMGAFLSLTSRINLFDVRIDRDTCTDCLRCVGACPTFALTPETVALGRPRITCSKCGACFEACPARAIGFSLKGVSYTAVNHPLRAAGEPAGFWRRLALDLLEPGSIFIFGIFTLATVIAFSSFTQAASRLLHHFLGV